MITKWGDWYLENGCLVIDNRHDLRLYSLPLAEVKDDYKSMVRLIAQVLEKTWADGNTMRDLLLALESIFGLRSSPDSWPAKLETLRVEWEKIQRGH